MHEIVELFKIAKFRNTFGGPLRSSYRFILINCNLGKKANRYVISKRLQKAA